MCGVGLCVELCLWCVVCCCVLRVWRGLARGKTRVQVQKVSVCRFKTLPCVPAKRAHVEHVRALCRHTRRRSEPTHGEERGAFSLSLFLLPSSFFFSLLPFSSFVLFFRSLSFLFSLSNNDSDHSSSRLCTHSSALAKGPECMDLGPFLVGRTCSQHARNNCLGVSCASLVPLGMKWACICAGNGCCVWWCLVVLVCGSKWYYVFLCDSMCCLFCVVGCRRCVGCCVVMTVQKKTKTTSVITEISRERIYFHYSLKLIRKNKSAPRQICNYFGWNGMHLLGVDRYFRDAFSSCLS